MKKITIIISLILLLLAAIVIAPTFTRDERSLIKECKLDCREDKKIDTLECKEELLECKNKCALDNEFCEEQQLDMFNSCQEECNELQNSKEIRSCSNKCKREHRSNKREFCSLSSCKKECSKEHRECRKEANKNYRSCTKNCKYTALNDNITCEDGKYKAGETFLQGCEVCECNFDSTVDCKKSNFCNFDNLKIDESMCESNGGYYATVCQGPYPRMRCSSTEYCQCSGTSDLTCPSDYTCINEFNIRNMPRGVPEYVDLSGRVLGDIGLCAKTPEIDTCGNDICENIVSENSIAETEFNCPADCKI